jgi:hypothetical protein
MITDDQLARLVQDFYAAILEWENKARSRGPILSEASRQARSQWSGNRDDSHLIGYLARHYRPAGRRCVVLRLVPATVPAVPNGWKIKSSGRYDPQKP